jgi:hypothetical protein
MHTIKNKIKKSEIENKDLVVGMKHLQHQHCNHHQRQHRHYSDTTKEVPQKRRLQLGNKRCHSPIGDLEFLPRRKTKFPKQSLQQSH